jgi:heme exporter protein C
MDIVLSSFKLRPALCYITMHKYFNPGRFLRLTDMIFPWCAVMTLLLLLSGLVMVWLSPVDYQQGNAVRIMYIHVPAAWMSLCIYGVMALASGSALIWKNPLSDMIAASAAPIGAAFALITLVTGSLWGKPIWGTWWVWDARLTSMLILFFFYIGYLALLNAYDDKQQAAKVCAILALVGFINVPIVKFSVDFWNTLHQPASILKSGGPSIHPSMLIPLLLMIAGYMGLFASLLMVRVKTEIVARKILRIQQQRGG